MRFSSFRDARPLFVSGVALLCVSGCVSVPQEVCIDDVRKSLMDQDIVDAKVTPEMFEAFKKSVQEERNQRFTEGRGFVSQGRIGYILG